jgi:siroheme synthase-like protein
MKSSLFPAFLKLAGRRCLVVGGGPVAEEKIAGLIRTGARLHVVAPHVTDQIQSWARAKTIRWSPRIFRAADLSGVFLVVAASSSPVLHAQIYRDAKRHGILCNVVDDPKHCDFYYGAIVRRGALQIAISTAGHSPALAQRLKNRFEQEIGSEYESWVTNLGKERKRLFARKLSPQQRRRLLHQLASRNAVEEFRRSRKPRPKIKRP